MITFFRLTEEDADAILEELGYELTDEDRKYLLERLQSKFEIPWAEYLRYNIRVILQDRIMDEG